MPVVSAWIWTASVVCTENAQVACGVLFHQPDEAVAEHGVGGFEEVLAEVVEVVEVCFDVLEESGGRVGERWSEGFEEPVVVYGHRRDVEKRGMLGGVGVFLGQFDGGEVIVDGAFGGSVEFVAEVAHISVPVHLHAPTGHEFGDTEFGNIPGHGRKFGDGMFEAALALGDGRELCRVRRLRDLL